MDCPISKYLYTEARFLAKYVGHGGELPSLQHRTHAFSEKEVADVIQFVLSEKNCSGLAWGSKSHITAEGKIY